MKKSKRRLPKILGTIFFVLLVAAVIVLVRVYEFEKPTLSMLSENKILGSNSELTFSFRDEKSGVQSIEAFLEQNGRKVKLFSQKQLRKSYLTSGGPKAVTQTFVIDAKDLGLENGRAELLVTVRDFSFWNWMQGNEATASYPVLLDMSPPRLTIIDSPAQIKPGSAAIVVYRADEPLENYGVTINGYFHPGFLIPSRGPDTYGSLIALPYDQDNIDEASVSGNDQAGNESRANFGMSVKQQRLKTDRINLSDSFLQQKVPEFAQHYPEMTGSILEQYLYVNRQVRAQNAAAIAEACKESVPEKLWDGRFNRMRRSSRRAGYADYRSYYYNGEKVDEQVHLGIDLASVRRADVEAANRGKVVFADYLGIYGNMVILDHGLGVFSLYSHLSQITVNKGDLVEKGARIGKTGTSGMAGGDHLHFSILVNGIFVNPLEWWDLNWLKINILNYLSGTSG